MLDDSRCGARRPLPNHCQNSTYCNQRFFGKHITIGSRTFPSPQKLRDTGKNAHARQECPHWISQKSIRVGLCICRRSRSRIGRSCNFTRQRYVLGFFGRHRFDWRRCVTRYQRWRGDGIVQTIQLVADSFIGFVHARYIHDVIRTSPQLEECIE